MPESHFRDAYNEAQRRAVLHLHGPAIVVAGPGSGKTRVLTGRIRCLVERGVDPAHILVITFTKAAALSMQSRFIREMKGRALPVAFGTFHAIFFSILKEHFSLRDDCLLSGGQKRKILISHLLENEKEYAEELLSCISRYKNGVSGDRLILPEAISAERFAELLRLCEQECRRLGKMDFDDMLTRCRDLLVGDPKVLKSWQARFTHILVDEFQDCNPVQYEVLKMLAYPENNLFVVGDDDQSVYGFRGAGPGIMRQFKSDFGEAALILMESNYRSRREIVEAASAVIAKNRDRFDKKSVAVTKDRRFLDLQAVNVNTFPDKKEQYAHIAVRCRALAARIPYAEMAVLCRTNRELAGIIPFLEAQKLPFYVKTPVEGRMSHFAVRDVYTYLKLAADGVTRGELLKIAERPRRGIGREALWEEEVDLLAVAQRLSAEGKDKEAGEAKTLCRRLKLLKEMSPQFAIRMVRKGMGYDEWLKGEAGTDIEKRRMWQDILDEMQEQAACFLNLGEWLSYMEADPGEGNGKKAPDKDGIQLMTLHASKGLEFSYVCIPNVNEGNIPQGKIQREDAVEEERRLFYVGMTRAKAALDILCLADAGRERRLQSRFLEELPYSSPISSSNS